MKQVFNKSDVAHIWANQTQESGRNSQGNFYFRNGTIYSYGSHFPIATIKGNDVFFTLRSYSNTTARHISEARQAASHKNFIWVHDVPEDFRYLSAVHESNLNYWKRSLNSVFSELGNPKIRNTQSRVNTAAHIVAQLETYCQYFKLPIKDKDLKKLVALTKSPDFIAKARDAKANEEKIKAAKMKQAAKAYNSQYLPLWRSDDNEGLKDLPEKIKSLCSYYVNNTESFTRLRFNTVQNRVETSKGVQIPAEVAKRAYLALNGCLEGKCEGLQIPVLGYTIEKTTETALIAGCHTIPKEDVKYIANLLNW